LTTETSEPKTNPYVHQDDTPEILVLDNMQGEKAYYEVITAKVGPKSKFQQQGKDGWAIEGIKGFWSSDTPLNTGQVIEVQLSRKPKYEAAGWYQDMVSVKILEGNSADESSGNTAKVPVPVSNTGYDSRNKSIEKQVAVKGFVEMTPHVEALVSAGFMSKDTAIDIIRFAYEGCKELYGEEVPWNE